MSQPNPEGSKAPFKHSALYRADGRPRTPKGIEAWAKKQARISDEERRAQEHYEATGEDLTGGTEYWSFSRGR